MVTVAASECDAAVELSDPLVNPPKVPVPVADEGGTINGCITFIGTRFPERTGTIDSANSAGNGLFLSDWLAYYCSLKNVVEGTYDVNDLWPPERLNDAPNADYTVADWANISDLTQQGKKVAPTIASDAEEYKLYDSNSFIRTGATQDFPVKVIGSQAVEGTVVEFTIYVPQGSTPRTVTTLSIDGTDATQATICLLYTSPSPRDLSTSRMPSSA